MKKITRTIEFTEAVVLFANVDERKMEERKVTLPAVYESETELRKDIPTDGKFIPLTVISTRRYTKKYAIDVRTFIESANEISDETPSDDD